LKGIVIIGGPNGAGQTTAALSVVPQALDIPEFVHHDTRWAMIERATS